MLLFNSPALLLETTALLKFKAAPPLLLCLYPLKLLLLGSFFCKRPALAFLLCLLVFNLCMLFRLFSSLCLLLSYPPGLLLSLRYLCCCSSFCVFPATGLFLSFTPSGCSKVLCFFPASCSFFCLQFLYLCYLFCLFSASNCFCRFPLVNFCDFFCLFSALCSLVGLLFVSLCQRLCPLTAPSFFLRFSVLFLCEPLRHLSFFLLLPWLPGSELQRSFLLLRGVWLLFEPLVAQLLQSLQPPHGASSASGLPAAALPRACLPPLCAWRLRWPPVSWRPQPSPPPRGAWSGPLPLAASPWLPRSEALPPSLPALDAWTPPPLPVSELQQPFLPLPAAGPPLFFLD
mmetsp:Transcript_82565/g.146254  ORF Transcript_82565/g.146254 Transcript_82565/m.146254 type:complete len:344 (-) Transcript_82565:1083-2114(-)